MISDIIRARRIEKGLTMAQLGEELGYSRKVGESTVQQWESGKRKVPMVKWRKLSTILSIPIEEFLPK